MAEFAGPVEAYNALVDYLMDRVDPLPEQLRECLRVSIKHRSPVAGMIQAVEFVYARDRQKGDVPESMLEWAAAAAMVGDSHQFAQFAADRGALMAKTLRRQRIAKDNIPAADVSAIQEVDPPERDGAPKVGDVLGRRLEGERPIEKGQ